MKKTVIKRRKRVPAAPGMSFSAIPTTLPGGRLTDQAAAEALVAVGRMRGMGGEDTEGDEGEEEEGEEMEQPPRKKRATRTRGRGNSSVGAVSTRRTRSSAEKDAMDVEEHDHEEGSISAPEAARKRGQVQNGWVEGRSASPHHAQHHQNIHRVPSRNLVQQHHSHPPHPHHPHPHEYLHQQYLHRTSPFAPQPGVGGFELPPLAALSSPGGGGPFAGLMGGIGGTPSSYIRSGSNAPSRTHSPSLPGYPVPPYYGGGPADMMMMGISGMPGPGGGVPSVGELERHYFELHESKRRLEEMVERTERLMLGVKRGIEEMRGGSASPMPGAGPSLGSAGQQQGSPQQGQQQEGGMHEKNSPSSWPVDPKLSGDGSPSPSAPALQPEPAAPPPSAPAQE